MPVRKSALLYDILVHVMVASSDMLGQQWWPRTDIIKSISGP